MSAKPQMTHEPANGQIFALIPKIMGDVGFISKGRKNQSQGYSFRGVDDVYAAFQGPLSKHGVFYIPEVIERESTERQTKSGGTMVYTTLTVAYTFFAPDGSCVRAVVVGEAMDSGDKSANKAMSAALKYALLQIFCVPVEAADDADNETHEFAPRQRTASAPPQGEASARQPVSGPQTPSKPALPNQLDWIAGKVVDIAQACQKRFNIPVEQLDFETATKWIAELRAAK